MKLRDEACRRRLFGIDQGRGEKHVFDPRLADKPDETVQIADGKAVSERARDRGADLQVAASDPDVERGRDGGAAAGTETVQCADGRNAAFLDHRQRGVDPVLIVDGVGGGEGTELRDVRAGGKGGIAAPGEDQHPERVGVVRCAGTTADLLDPVIHPEGQRVAPVRPVQDNMPDAIGSGIDEILVFAHVDAPCQVRPQRRFRTDSASQPARRPPGAGCRRHEAPFRHRSAFRQASGR